MVTESHHGSAKNVHSLSDAVSHGGHGHGHGHEHDDNIESFLTKSRRPSIMDQADIHN